MKLRYNIFYTIVVGLLFLSCSHFEEVEPEQLKPVEKVQMVLTAHMDMEDPLTKTYLAGDPVASSRYTYWLPTDEIGVLGLSLGKFTNTSADTSAVAVFEGESELSSQYYAIYPYPDQNFQSAGDGKLIFNIPAVQKYQKNTFATDVVPMVTKFKSGEELYFKNACGGLVIKVKGVEKIKSMRLVAYEQTGVEAKIAGQCLVDMNAEEYVITPEASASTSVSIDCGEGVQLNESEPTAFHFALAPATYHGFRVVMMSEDGKFMVKETDKELNIKRANITYAAPFSFEESESVDLSLRGTSNCYVISEANRYRFNASVIGNGTYGIIPDASFHTSDPSIEPVSVKVLWETTGANIKTAEGEMLSDVILKDGYVHFTSTGKEGNALIAVKDADGNILWSWHIWMTDQPVDQTYVNSTGTFVMQDRNLGAVRADQGSGDEYKESHGLLYQWGRKDPFSLDNLSYITWKSTSTYSVEDIIRQPTALSAATNSFASSSNWTKQDIIDFWSDESKTIYDPCPVGYKVSLSSAWSDFTDLSNIQSSYDHGLMVKFNATEYAWYPFTYYHDYWAYRNNKDEGRIQIWSSNQRISNTSNKWTDEKSLSYDKNDSSKGLILTDVENVCALSVRCMKDDGFVDLAQPSVEMVGAKDVTAESATLSFNIKNEGASEVTDAGIIYGTTPGLSLENGTKVPRMGEENSVEVTGLTEGTKYYAVAYATNSYGTAYSKEIVFYTEFANSTNLSKYGTSNCYIVSEYGAYSFDASVRGNSTESVGSPVSAEVLWETKNTTKASAGEIIRSGSVELSGDFVTFVANGVEGNALIAVKDALGTILWSWHIWITDQPQDQHYINSLGDFYVLDRNLGATRADRGTGDEWKESSGFIYQWGRKDPFADGHYERVRSKFTIEESIEKPTTYAEKNSPWTSEWSDYLWADEKTVYDPCPVGYKISSKDIWAGFTTNGENVYSQSNINASGKYDYGWNFFIDGTNTAWFPANPHIGYSGPFEYHDDVGHAWCSTPAFIIEFKASQVEFESTATYQAFPVRCMREHDINIVLGTSPTTQITKTSAVIHGSMGYLGDVYLDEMGFVWSSTNEMPVLSSSKETVDIKEGEFSCTLTGLSPATTYYVRTFATEGNITIYGPVVSFTTQLSAGNEGVPEDDDYEWN